jgi:hypothetical protein
MATNPQIPLTQPRKPVLVPGRAPAPPARGHRILAGLIGLTLVLALLVYAWRVREARMQSPVSVTAPADDGNVQSELEFSDLQMTQTPGNGRLDIYGSVVNQGNHHITRAVVQLTFKDAQGRTVATLQKPIQGRFNEQYRTLADDFPIEPGESRFFQIVLNQIPPKWDHNMPDIKVITVGFPE